MPCQVLLMSEVNFVDIIEVSKFDLSIQVLIMCLGVPRSEE